MIRELFLTWLVAAVLVVVTGGVGVAVTGPGISAGETAVLILAPLHLGIWLGSTAVFLWRTRGEAALRRVIYGVGHLTGSAGAAVIGGFVLLVVFNR